MRLELYNRDGANWQARCVLAYMQSIDIFGGLSIMNQYGEYDARIEVGRFENFREQGYVFSVHYKDRQMNYAVYEHRNSDAICVVRFEKYTLNTPTLDDVLENMKDKYDYTMSFNCGKIMECGDWIREDIRKFINELKES